MADQAAQSRLTPFGMARKKALRTVLVLSSAGLLGLCGAAGPVGATASTGTTTTPPGGTTTTVLGGTTTTTAPGGTTTTTAPRGPTTTAPRPTTSPARPQPTPATTSPPPPPPPLSGGTGDNPAPNAPFPPALLAIANSVHRSAPSNTSALIAALAPLERAGMTPLQAEVAGMGKFPVAGEAYYTDDWLEPRPGPVPHLHMGDDIVAPSGTPLRAPTTGVLTYSDSDPSGYGLTAIVTQTDHSYFVMAHMSATVGGLASGSKVTVGQIIGFVGATGDATGPHCHFEVHPGGRAGADPKPYLDRWQAEAIAGIPAVLAAYQGGTVKAAVNATPVLPAPSQLAPGPSEYPSTGAEQSLGGGNTHALAAVRTSSDYSSSTRVGLIGLILLLGTGASTLDVTWRSRRARSAGPDPTTGS